MQNLLSYYSWQTTINCNQTLRQNPWVWCSVDSVLAFTLGPDFGYPPRWMRIERGWMRRKGGFKVELGEREERDEGDKGDEGKGMKGIKGIKGMRYRWGGGRGCSGFSSIRKTTTYLPMSFVHGKKNEFSKRIMGKVCFRHSVSSFACLRLWLKWSLALIDLHGFCGSVEISIIMFNALVGICRLVGSLLLLSFMGLVRFTKYKCLATEIEMFIKSISFQSISA